MQAELFFSEMNGVTKGKRSAGALPNNRLVIVSHIASVAYIKFLFKWGRKDWSILRAVFHCAAC